MDYTRNGRYRIVKHIGSGSFGKVYLADDTLNPSIPMALKVIPLHRFSRDLLVKEVAHQKSLSAFPDRCSESIVCYVDSFEAPLGDDGRPAFVIVSKYIDGGSLRDYIRFYKSRRENIPPADLWIIMRQLVSGLSYIHQSGAAHRDIKPANIMIASDGHLLYIDLGLMCSDSCKPGAGTVSFFSPEMLEKRVTKSLDQAKAHDVWSLGIVFYNMCMFTNPSIAATGDTPEEVSENILNYIDLEMPGCNYTGSSDSLFNSLVNYVVEWMLTYDVNHRPLIHEINEYIIAESGTCIDQEGNEWSRRDLIDAIIRDQELPESMMRKDLLCTSRGFSAGAMI